ncbi:SpoIIE family protein phosphatase, partial [bacterium]|nr:SpoIIE family protein phosphatase [bacterium]
TMVDFLREIGAAFAEAVSIDDLLTIVLHTARCATDAEAGAIYITSNKGDEMTAHVIEGLFPPLVDIHSNTERKWTSKQKYIHEIVKSYPIKPGQGVLGKVLEDGQPCIIENDEDNPHPLIPRFASEFLKLDNIVVVPLKVKNKIYGVMAVVNKRQKKEFESKDLSILESLGEQAVIALLNFKLSTELAEKKQVEWEMRVAEDIQRLLLPQELPQIPGFELAAMNKPVRTVGGDYYDIVKLDHERYAIIVADVSGKGVPGAITIAIFRSLFRNYALKFQSPAKVLVEINNWLYGEIKEDMFITALYAVLYPKERRLVWSRAGHEPVLFYSKRENATHVFSGMGIMMGMTFGSEFDSFIEENELIIGPEDVIMLYTDGLVEIKDEHGHEFGRENVCGVIRETAHCNAGTILAQMSQKVINFSSTSNFQDDITMVVLKKKHSVE